MIDAGPGGQVPAIGDPVVLGVVEYTVTANAPPLVPITSERAAYLRVRSWGRATSDYDLAPAGPVGTAPYIGSLGSCGPPKVPPRGATRLLAIVDRGHEIDRHTIGPEEFVFYFEDGVTDEMRASLSETFGPATTYEHAAVRLAWSRISVWVPHAVAGLVVVAVLLALLRRGRRRSVEQAARP